MKSIEIIQLGITDYHQAWNYQKKLFDKVVKERAQNYLLLTEHNPVITVGKSGSLKNLLATPAQLASQGIELIDIDRGGDITFHGPGQLVGYPILDLTQFEQDIHWYLRMIEEVIIKSLMDFGINGERIENLTGVWVKNRKICAIGVKVTRWVTMHGFALNISTDLEVLRRDTQRNSSLLYQHKGEFFADNNRIGNVDQNNAGSYKTEYVFMGELK